jgi:hypothetical protein
MGDQQLTFVLVGTSVATTRPRSRDAGRTWRDVATVAWITRTYGRVLSRTHRAVTTLMTSWGPEGGDAVLYGLATLFALLTGLLGGLPGYRVWAWFAIGPYAAGALVSAYLGRRRKREAAAAAQGSHWGPARVWILLFLLVGATLAPLSAEVALRNDGPTTSHVQPEVVVIAQAGQRLVNGKDLYSATVHDGHVQSAVPGEPTFESFFPYLPLMAVFGLPNIGKGPTRVTDTRVLFSIVTLIVVGAALLALRAPRDRKLRALQFITVLPTAALPLATGGDDMPVVAFLLLAMVLAQRRRPGWSGIVLGVASAMKFTAWPLAALALFCARDRTGRRAPGRMLLGIVGVAGPVVAPFAASTGRAFFDNVILFPLGLSGVASPAASNLPGHVLVTELPFLHTALPVAVAAVGGILLVRRLWRRPPRTPADVVTLAGWIMLVAIVFAPATRVGYLLYPADFFAWGLLLKAADRTGADGREVMAGTAVLAAGPVSSAPAPGGPGAGGPAPALE